MAPKGEIKIGRLQQRALVTNREQLTRTGTIKVSFDVLDDERFNYAPGQFVAIDFEHPQLGYRRSPYCICSPPNGRRFDLLVRVVREGPVSLFINDLREGDLISFRGPTGPSMFPKQGGLNLVLIATGVGVSPFFPLLEALFKQHYHKQITFYWGLRQVEDICLTETLDRIAERHSNFSYHISLSNPSMHWTGLRGRVTESVPPLLKTLQDKHFILSGNGAMIVEMSDALAEVGVPTSRIYEEVFFNLSHQPEPAVIASIRSRFTASDIHSVTDCLNELLTE